MPKITLLKDDKEYILDAEIGENILEIALANDIEIQHNCGGVCACSTCHIHVLDGMENLSELTDEEEEQLDEAWDLSLDSRLSCQCVVSGDAKVKVIN
ncbi:MAG: ferredoxin [Calditrichaeota bacterium]|nr:MAG: ferredoxin [Calditrichota bacterium]